MNLPPEDEVHQAILRLHLETTTALQMDRHVRPASRRFLLWSLAAALDAHAPECLSEQGRRLAAGGPES